MQKKKEKESKEAIKAYTIFVNGNVDLLEGHCTFSPYSVKCYARPCTSAFSEEVSNKFGLIRTIPRPQYFNHVLSLMQTGSPCAILHNTAPNGINNSLLSKKIKLYLPEGMIPLRKMEGGRRGG